MSVQPTVRTLRAVRQINRRGTMVAFRGRNERVLSVVVAGNLTGTNTLPVTDLALSRLFRFNPLRYQPYTDEPAPFRDEILFYHNDGYIIRQVSYSDRNPDTYFINAYAYCITRSGTPVSGSTEGITLMALSTKINRTLTAGGVTIGSSVDIANADGAVVVQRAILPGATDFLVTIPTLTMANLQAYGMDVDKGALTVKTNNATTPGQTAFVLTPNGVPPYSKYDPTSSFISSGTLSAVYLTNATQDTILFSFIGVPDLTPTA